MDLSFIASLLGWLVPLGILLLAVGASPEDEAKKVMTSGLLAIPVAVLIYAILGFGLQFGGLGLVSDLPGVETLRREWSPLDVAWGPGWGIIGLDGFYLLSGAFSPGLLAIFVHQSALVATVAVIPTAALARRLQSSHVFGISLFIGGFFYPIFGNWIWSGGWLSQLGRTVALGHGTIDFAGGATIFGLGAGVALAGILALGSRLPAVRGLRGPVTPPPVHFPLLATVGTFLVAMGAIALALSNPLLSGASLKAQAGVNLLLTMLGGLLLALLYTWFATSSPDLFMALRGAVAGLVAGLAPGPFVPPWGALALGAVSGLLVPLVVYGVDVRWRWDDPAATIATFLVPGLLGLASLGILADGRNGTGWNGVGEIEYLGIPGQGVSGLLVPPGYQPTLGQLYAQLVGVVALVVMLFLVGLVFRVLLRVREVPASGPIPLSQDDPAAEDKPAAGHRSRSSS